MLSPDTKIRRAAIQYGETYHRAHKTRDMEDRKKFIKAEIALGWAALAIYDLEKERSRVKSRRSKS